jgi:hypothetical protein
MKEEEIKDLALKFQSGIIESSYQINKKLEKENKQLKDRIEKAAEYIEQLGHSEWASFGRMILLEILKEDNKED